MTLIQHMLRDQLQDHTLKKLKVSLDGKDTSGKYIHTDVEVWPTVGCSFPLSSAVIDVKVDDHALEFLVPHESLTKPHGGAL